MKIKEFLEIARISYDQLKLCVHNKEKGGFLPVQEVKITELRKYGNWEIVCLNAECDLEAKSLTGAVSVKPVIVLYISEDK